MGLLRRLPENIYSHSLHSLITCLGVRSIIFIYSYLLFSWPMFLCILSGNNIGFEDSLFKFMYDKRVDDSPHTGTVLINLHHIKQILSFTLLYRRRNQNVELLGSLPKVSPQERREARILAQLLVLLTLTYAGQLSTNSSSSRIPSLTSWTPNSLLHPQGTSCVLY